MHTRPLIIIIGLSIAGGVLGFLWWTIAPLFIDTRVDDALPTDTSRTDNADTNTPTLPATESDVNMSADTGTHTEPPSTDTLHPIQDTPAHPASGAVRIVESPGETIVRYENYSGTNGPDLYVYLAKDLDATEFIDLGRAKGNQGNINYTVPDTIDISEYSYVLTWCKAFGVLFDYAEIQ